MMDHLLSGIYRFLLDGEDISVATIISATGSTPLTSGSRMVICQDGRTSGTIGGGGVEADVIRKALELFVSKDAVIVSYNLNNPSAKNQLDLICGGSMEVLIEYVTSSVDNIEMYRRLLEGMQTSSHLLWVGRLFRDQNSYRLERSLQVADGQWGGTFTVSPQLAKALAGCSVKPNATALQSVGDQEFIIESIVPRKTVYLVGGGHISKAVAELLRHLEFRTIVIDDRPEFADSERFPFADSVLVCPQYHSVFEEFTINTDSYILIVTRGHYFDKEVLAQALETDAGYIGMIGSRRKRDTIYGELNNQGTGADQLVRVHCPVGLSIDAETAAEIAISIVAQLIQHRAGQRAHD